MKKISIQTKTPYNIYLGNSILDKTGEIVSELGNFKNIAIVTDDIVEKLYLQEVLDSFSSDVKISYYVIPNGEPSKDVSMLMNLYSFFIDSNIKRSDLIIALGGGVVGDLVGFASSSFLRGVKFLQIPTTLLAQVDSSVGGKTAINIPAGKNLVGSFYQPIAVICDINTLSSLSDKIFNEGMAEVIKYGCIWDKNLFKKLYSIEDKNVLAEVVEACINIKAEVVSQDEFDNGLRMILNFGHTIGHAVEKHFGFGKIFHGEGVAIGMAHITLISETLGLTEKGSYQEIIDILKHFNLPYECTLENEEIFTVSGHDKKGVNGFINLIILKNIGECFIHKISFEDYNNFLNTNVSDTKAVLPTKYNAVIKDSVALKGSVQIPASKSIMHRAIICASLCENPSVIQNVTVNDDIIATLDCLSQIGLSYSLCGTTLNINPIDKNAIDHSKTYHINCNESGSTIRFLIPVFAALGVKATFNGKGKLPTRPLTIFQDVFEGSGVEFDYDGVLPATISGKLSAKKYTVKGNVSSQFITGLLLALPLLHEDSIVEVLAPFESKSYVDITLSVMKDFGISVDFADNCYYIKGSQSFTSCEFWVESDFSAVAFFLVANCINPQNQIKLMHFPKNSVQGDSKIIDIIKSTGATISNEDGVLSVEVQNKLQAFDIDAGDIPDLVPILCVLATACEGTSKISNVERLKIKECDRIKATTDLITTLGGEISYNGEFLSITGVESLHGGDVDSYNDHRIAMCGAISASYATGSIAIKNAHCVSKSFPTFFNEYKNLGGEVNVINVE